MPKTTKRIDFCNRAHKVIFHTDLDAKIALAERIAKDKGERRFYRCKFANHYHLTSQEARHQSEKVKR